MTVICFAAERVGAGLEARVNGEASSRPSHLLDVLTAHLAPECRQDFFLNSWTASWGIFMTLSSLSVVSLPNSRCSGAHGVFIAVHYGEQTVVCIRHGVVFPVGAVFRFLACLTPYSSKICAFSSALTLKHNTKPLSQFT